jgi:hypothetical protein
MSLMPQESIPNVPLRLHSLKTARQNIKTMGFDQKEQACLSGPVNLLVLQFHPHQIVPDFLQRRYI